MNQNRQTTRAKSMVFRWQTIFLKQPASQKWQKDAAQNRPNCKNQHSTKNRPDTKKQWQNQWFFVDRQFFENGLQARIG